MKHARIVYEGAIHAATEAGPGRIRLADGRVLPEEAVSCCLLYTSPSPRD